MMTQVGTWLALEDYPMNMRIPRILLSLVAATLALSIACGGSDNKAGGGVAGDAVFGGQVSDRDQAKAVEDIVNDVVKNPEKARQAADEVAQRGMSGAGRCEVNVSGDENVSFSSGGGVAAVGSDYWYSEDELRKSLRALARLGGAKSDAEIDREVDAAMKQDPRLTLLVVNCGSPGDKAGGSLSLLPGNESRYADVPFGAKSYTIASGGALGGNARAGEFNAVFSLKDGIWALDEPGKLEITRFDKTGIAGRFTFRASERFADGTPRNVTVQGTFDFPCQMGANCKR
jgi:hypothetical protein